MASLQKGIRFIAANLDHPKRESGVSGESQDRERDLVRYVGLVTVKRWLFWPGSGPWWKVYATIIALFACSVALALVSDFGKTVAAVVGTLAAPLTIALYYVDYRVHGERPGQGR